MKKLAKILWRDKVDLGFWIATIAFAVARLGFGIDTSTAFVVYILYGFSVMTRMKIATDIIRNQDFQIRDLNKEIEELKKPKP